MPKHRHYFLWISILIALPACNDAIEQKHTSISEDKTNIRVNWSDSMSKLASWIEGKDVTGYTGSTMLGDLSAVIDIDSATIVKFESDYSMTNCVQGSIRDSTLERFHYPLRSNSGGSVDGFYDSTVLIRIESIFDAEFGYSAIDVDFKNGEIEKIKYHQHFADYAQYSRDFPDSKDLDPKKLTYTDTSYLLQFIPINHPKNTRVKNSFQLKLKET